MKGRQIVLDEYAGREAAALLVDGRLDDLLIDGDGVRPGAIYRAKADRPMKGQGGMFLTTPDGPVFLRQVKGLKPGAPLLVQVTGSAEPGKAVPVTGKLLFKSRFAIVTPGAPGLNVSRRIRDEDMRDALLELAHEAMGGTGEMGLILRSSCAEGDPEDIAEDILAMRDLAREVTGDATGEPEKLTEGDGPHILAWRDWVEPAEVETGAGGFERLGVLDAIEALQGPHVPLRGAGHMYVEPTRALVAVDVNTGGDTSPAAGLKANMAAMRDLPRQLRLRGLGGQIVVDMAPMAKKDRRVVETELRRALKTDTVETAMVGWTNLGHYELQRARLRAPLSEAT